MPRLELAEFLPARLKIETCLFARRVAREEQLIITLARHKHGAGGSRGHGTDPYCPAIAPAAAGLTSRRTAASRAGVTFRCAEGSRVAARSRAAEPRSTTARRASNTVQGAGSAPAVER